MRTPCPCLINDRTPMPWCEACRGDGSLDEIGPPRCDRCMGDGDLAGDGPPHEPDDCPVCEGTGLGSQWLPPEHRHATVWREVYAASGSWLAGGVVFDRDDQPRLLDDVRDADDSDWWLYWPRHAR